MEGTDVGNKPLILKIEKLFIGVAEGLALEEIRLFSLQNVCIKSTTQNACQIYVAARHTAGTNPHTNDNIITYKRSITTAL